MLVPLVGGDVETKHTWRHVFLGTCVLACVLRRGPGTKVAEIHRARICREEYIFELDVAVVHFSGVQVRDRVHELDNDAPRALLVAPERIFQLHRVEHVGTRNEIKNQPEALAIIVDECAMQRHDVGKVGRDLMSLYLSV
jgi:hypothetical protein